MFERCTGVVRTLVVCALFSVVLGQRPAQAEDAPARLIAELESARSFKVRVQAAALLARTGDARATSALARAATQDAEALVREVAVRLLAGAPGGEASVPEARRALRAARGDRAPSVRRAAVSALATLDRTLVAKAASPEEPVVGVRGVADKTGRASPLLKQRMRLELANTLRSSSRTAKVVDLNTDGAVPATYVIDAAIARLDVQVGAREAEVTCAVELIVSRPPRGIATIATGEATVSRPRGMWKPEHRVRLEDEAMGYAVRSAHENLSRFFASLPR